MGQSPRYTTFREGELEATLHRLDPQGQHHRHAEALGGGSVRSRSGLVTSHCCPVSYPDGQPGTCRYTRGGPAWHIFRFEHTDRDGHTTSLPVQYETQRMGNTLAAIEEGAQRLAPRAFSEAVKRERREHFQRAVPPLPYQAASARLASPQSAKRPQAFPQMKAKEAKEVSGKYALCIRLGRSILPTGNAWETLDEAVEAWRTQGSPDGSNPGGSNTVLIIGCCCRWKRRWEEPRFNPLHGDPSYPQPSVCPGIEPAREEAFHALQEADNNDQSSEEERLPHPEGPFFPPLGDEDVPPEEPDNSPDPFWTDETCYEHGGGANE